TGDLDAVLTLWVSLYCLLHLHYIINQKIFDWKYFYLMGFGFCLAFYSKSSEGLIPVAGIFITLLVERRLKEIFTSKHFWYSLLLFCSICLSYYIIRESLAPGYLAKAWYSEYERMYKKIMRWHEE